MFSPFGCSGTSICLVASTEGHKQFLYWQERNHIQVRYVIILGLVAALGSYARTLSTTPLRVSRSLGASGAILALIGYTVTKFPEARFSIALLDQIYPHSFTAQTVRIVVVSTHY